MIQLNILKTSVLSSFKKIVGIQKMFDEKMNGNVYFKNS